MNLSEEKVDRIKKHAKKLLLSARHENDLQQAVAQVVEQVTGMEVGQLPQVTWSRIATMRRVRIWVPGEIGYITVNADDGS